jgi:hypothetical protein
MIVTGKLRPAIRAMELNEEIVFSLDKERSLRALVTMEHRNSDKRYRSRIDSLGRLFYLTRTK